MSNNSDKKSVRLKIAPKVTGEQYYTMGHGQTAVMLRVQRMSAKPPKDCAVFFPNHLSLKEIEKFQRVHRHMVSPWGTQAGSYLLKVAAYKDDFIIGFELFAELRKEIFVRFANNAEGNVTIVDPRPETEPANSMLELVLNTLDRNQKVHSINGIEKNSFVFAFRTQLMHSRQQYGRREKNFSAQVFRIR